ncbi:M36 family metallopeptidase [Ilumatobacter sp.]|uniref:M36 family metallopeptidase n=1 Tax=Ilumatobacter sp. TaxID=1967498 RepID=UPI003F6BC1A6
MAVAVQDSAESIKAGELVVKDVIPTQHHGVTHVYLQQQQGGIDVAGAIANVAVKDGEVAFEASDELSLAASGAEAMPFGPLDALQSAALALDLTPTAPTLVLEEAIGPDRAQLLSDSGIAGRPIPARLVYQQIDRKSVRLAWEFEIETIDRTNIWQIRIDTENGEELERNNLIVHETFDVNIHADHSPSFRSTLPTWLTRATERQVAGQSPSDPSSSYRVFAQPLEAPSFGERSVQFDPFDISASPLGWHDTDGEIGSDSTLTVGNNVSAYSDLDNLNRAATGSQPDGGDSHNFDFPINFDGPASAYTKAAVTNLFYWNNVAHDFLYAYGFDEEAGNFQFNNYGNGGEGGDHVHAEAQDGGGTNNANFYTPPDGSSPRMQMYLWTNPERDGDFDNGIILHEYGHGLSIRLTGGPSTSSCLNNKEQAGEGWSDYLGLIATMTTSDLGSDGRGIGTYALGQTRNGPGIRQYRYSTDLEVDPRTYSSIKNASVPHGVGSVFAAMLWEMTWGLIEVHGFDSNLARGSGGNNLAMQLVVDGLKLQTCSPGFIDSRDAILAADAINNQSANKCIIWTAFAKRGLGYSATQGSSSSVADGVEAFDLDPTCRPLTLTKSSPSAEAYPDSEVDYLLTVSNQQGNESQSNVVVTDSLPLGTSFVEASATCGGTTNSGVITFSLGSLEPGESRECGFSVRTAAGDWSIIELDDDFDSLDALWGSTSLNGDNPDWTSISTTDDPDAGFSTGSAGVSDKILTLSNAVPITSQTTLKFSHRYNIESGFDGGVVEISVDDGSSWSDIGPFITVGGYNAQISSRYGSPVGGRSAFSGSQLEYATAKADLSTFAGNSALVRFRLASDSSITSQGWWIDDISIGYQASIANVATATSGANTATSNTVVTTLVAAPSPGAPGRPTSVSGLAGDGQVVVSWAAPEDNGDSAITGYTVTATPDGNKCSSKAGDLNCAVTGLVNGTSYTFAVVATNDRGNSAASASSAVIQPLGVPGQPTSVIGLAGDSQVVVSWTAPEDDGDSAITGYSVHSSPGEKTCRTTGDRVCTVSGLTNGVAYSFTVTATNSVGSGPASLASNAATPSSKFVGLTPSRILETRQGRPTTVDGKYWQIGKRSARSVTEFQVTGRGGVTSDADAVVLNLTVTDPSAPGHLTIFPCGANLPNSSNLNYTTGQTVANSVVAKVGAGGKICIYTHSATQLIIDTNGYFPTGSKFVGLTPSRILETRQGRPTTVDGKYWQIGKRSARSVTEFQVTGRGGVTSDADAVVLNLTVTDPSAPGHLTIFPCGANLPNSSNLNYTTGQTVANSVVAKVGAGGKICIYTHSATQLIIDTNGYFPTG